MKKNLLVVLLVSVFAVALVSSSALAADKGGSIGPNLGINFTGGDAAANVGVKIKMPPYGDLAFLKNVPGLHYEVSAGLPTYVQGLLRVTIMRTRTLRPYFGPDIRIVWNNFEMSVGGVIGAEYGLGALGLPEKLSADASFRMNLILRGGNAVDSFNSGITVGAIYRFGGMD